MTSYLAACCCDDDGGGPGCTTWASFDFDYTLSETVQKVDTVTNGVTTSNKQADCLLRGTAYVRTTSGLGNYVSTSVNDIDLDRIEYFGQTQTTSTVPLSFPSVHTYSLEDPFGSLTDGIARIAEGYGLPLYFDFPADDTYNPELPESTYGRRLSLSVTALQREVLTVGDITIIDGVSDREFPFSAPLGFGYQNRRSLNTLQEIGEEEDPCASGNHFVSGKFTQPLPGPPSPFSELINGIDAVLLPQSWSGTIDSTDRDGFGTVITVSRNAEGGCSNVQFYQEDPRP